MQSARSNKRLIESLDRANERVGRAQLEFLQLVAQVDTLELWRGMGANDMAHWLLLRYGVSHWKACRWIRAAHALEGLPRVSDALALGELGIDKVVELTRFATPETERGLVEWARDVSCGRIRHRGDLARRETTDEVADVDRARSLTWWWFDDGRRFGLEAELPSAQGAVVARAIERLADSLPVMPDEDATYFANERRADALVALASTRLAGDPDPDRATVIVHAHVDAVDHERDGSVIASRVAGGFEIEGGPPSRARPPSGCCARHERRRSSKTRPET